MAGVSLSPAEAASLHEVYVGDDGAFNFGAYATQSQCTRACDVTGRSGCLQPSSSTT